MKISHITKKINLLYIFSLLSIYLSSSEIGLKRADSKISLDTRKMFLSRDNLDKNPRILSENSNIITNDNQPTPKCTIKICDETGGKCVDDNTCECNEDYTTLLNDKNYKLCNYLKKSRFSTAVLELLVGFGVGHFYSDRKVNGCFKMMIFMLFCCIATCSIAIGVKFDQEHPNSENPVVKFFFCIYACTCNIILSWQLFDFLMFVFGFYYDGNDVPFA